MITSELMADVTWNTRVITSPVSVCDSGFCGTVITEPETTSGCEVIAHKCRLTRREKPDGYSTTARCI